MRGFVVHITMKKELSIQELEPFLKKPIIVEGKKDIIALKEIGFTKLYPIHKPNLSMKEQIETLAEKAKEFHILTDFDQEGEKFYLLTKQVLQENGVRINDTLKKLIKSVGISHIEGLNKIIK